MSNVLSDDKQKQVIALGQLGWTLRRIENQNGIRQETAGAYLRAAGVPVRPPGRWGRPPAKEVTTDFGAELERSATAKPANEAGVTTDLATAKPANEGGQVTTDSGTPRPSRSPSASSCVPYHEFIEAAPAKGRNATAI